MDFELDWKDIKDFLKEYHISDTEQKELLNLIGYDTEIDFEDVTDYLKNHSSCYDEDDVLNAMGHECEYELDSNEKILIIENLNDEFKFETVKKLYNTLSLEQLEKIEKMVDMNII